MNENTLPKLQTQEEIWLEELRPYLLDPRENYPEPFYLLEFDGVPFSPLGGIQAISGQKKNGKSFVLIQLMAAVLGSGSERAGQFLPGLKVPERTTEHLAHETKVLYCDTEMEKLNTAKVLRRIHWLCEWPMNEPNDRLHVLTLRSVFPDETNNEKAYAKRFRLIRHAIEVMKPDMVVIDGIRDIIGNFNDNEESSILVQELMAIAEEKNICIWSALHMNPRPGNDDESKMRGHLGTELGNKVSDTLVSIKSKTASGITFTVKQQDARGIDLRDWVFEVTDTVGQLGIPRIINSSVNIDFTKKVKADPEEDIVHWLNIASGESLEWPLSRSDVKEAIFKRIGKVRNNDRVQADLAIAINKKWLIESVVTKNGHPLLELNLEEIPF